MLVRLNGLVLVVNTLLPAILLAALLAAFLANRTELARGWQETEASLLVIRDTTTASLVAAQTAAVNATASLRSAADRLETSGKAIDDAVTEAAKPLRAIEALQVKTVEASWSTQPVCAPLAKKACLNVQVPKLSVVDGWYYGAELAKPFRSAFDALAELAAPIGDIRQAFADLGILDEIPAHARQAQTALAVLAGKALALAPLVTALGYVLIGLLAWYAFQRVVRGFANLAAGWRMMTAPHTT